MTKRSGFRLTLAGGIVAGLAGLAACEDGGLILGPSLTLPDSGLDPFDAGTTAPFDAGDADGPDAEPLDAEAPGADAGDADDAGDAGDAGDAEAGADAGDAGPDDLYTGMLGSIGGTLYDETCPAGQLVIGVEGGESSFPFYSGVLTKLRFLCGVPTLSAAADGDVVVEAANFVPADPADARGGTDSASISQAVCPEHQVVVGIDGTTLTKNFPPVRAVVAQVRLRCAPLASVGGVVSLGAAELALDAIGAGGVGAGSFDCGAGKVATGLRIQAGNIVDALQVRCEPPVFP